MKTSVPRQLSFMCRQHAGRADPAGHVHVMAASVHDADFVAILVARPHLAGVREAGLLDDRQGVHVGADQDGGPGAVLDDADDAVAADFGGHLETEGIQLLGQSCSRLFLFVGKFGMRMQLFVEFFQGADLMLDFLLDDCDIGGRRPGVVRSRLSCQGGAENAGPDGDP